MNGKTMNDRVDLQRFVIERDLPGAGALTQEQLGELARKSCCVLDQLGPSIQWIHSYVTDDKIYCVYSAADEDLIRQHAVMGGFPATRVSRVGTIIDPSTAADA